MKSLISQKMLNLANVLDANLYVVGGACRDFLIAKSLALDVDLCSSLSIEHILPSILTQGFKVQSFDKRLGYIKFSDEKYNYEYTRFRQEKYEACGKHTPSEIIFTDDIILDAKRRDFKCNAVYFDIKNDKFIDPLGGIKDIENKVLSTVIDAKQVLSSDGERLFRLARFCGQLGFSIDKETKKIAKEFSSNVLDLKNEMIFSQLTKILYADGEKSFSPNSAHYLALKALREIGVLEKIFPYLFLAKELKENAEDKDDVLSFTLKCVKNAPKDLRLVTLLLGEEKAFNLYNKNKKETNTNITKEMLEKFNVSVKHKKDALFLINQFQIDENNDMNEKEVREYILLNYKNIDKLLTLKDIVNKTTRVKANKSQIVIKWKQILNKMKKEGVAFCSSELKISATELIEMGYKGKEIGEEQRKLMLLCAKGQLKNEKESLKIKAKEGLKTL